MPSFDDNLLPATTGLDLGSPTQKWDGYFQNTTTSGTQSVTGDLSTSGNLSVGGNATITGNTSSPISINSAAGDPTLNYKVGGVQKTTFAYNHTDATFYVNDTAGNIRIIMGDEGDTQMCSIGTWPVVTNSQSGASEALHVRNNAVNKFVVDVTGNGLFSGGVYVGSAAALASAAALIDANGQAQFFNLNIKPSSTVLFTLDSTGKITKYNSVATAGNGVASVHGATSQKAENAADTNVLTYTPAAAAGTYRISFEMSLSAANTATIGWTITYKDSNGNAQTPTNLSLFQMGTAAPALTFTTSAAGNYYGSVVVDVDNSATNIVVKTTFSGTSFTGKASATIERLQ